MSLNKFTDTTIKPYLKVGASEMSANQITVDFLAANQLHATEIEVQGNPVATQTKFSLVGRINAAPELEFVYPVGDAWVRYGQGLIITDEEGVPFATDGLNQGLRPDPGWYNIEAKVVMKPHVAGPKQYGVRLSDQNGFGLPGSEASYQVLDGNGYMTYTVSSILQTDGVMEAYLSVKAADAGNIDIKGWTLEAAQLKPAPII